MDTKYTVHGTKRTDRHDKYTPTLYSYIWKAIVRWAKNLTYGKHVADIHNVTC